MNFSQQVWLIRHGETEWSKSGQHTGWTDIPLLPESEPKLRRLAPVLGEHAFSLVLSSPLIRAYRTAELAGFTSITREPNLREWNYGDCEGQTKDQIRARIPNWNIWVNGVTGGETLDQVADRARKVIARAKESSGDVALIAHGHILRILAACWRELPPVNAEHFALSTGSISVLSYENDLPVLLRWNWQPENT